MNRRSTLSRWTPRFDPLEVRDCPTVFVVPDLTTQSLRVYGDQSDNRVSIVDNGISGIDITGDGQTFPTYKGFTSIAVGTGDGNDIVAITVGSGGGAGFGAQHKLDINLGGGNDLLNFSVAPGLLPPGPCTVAVKVDGSVGNDSLNFLVGDSAGNPATQAIGGEWLFDVVGGAGNDTIRTMMAGVQLKGAVTMNIQGGDGSDTVMQDFHHLYAMKTINDAVRGGGGDDSVDVKIVDGVFNASVNLNVAGDAGADAINLNVGTPITGELPPPTEGIFPLNPVFNSTLNFSLDGGQGNDQVAANVSVARGVGSVRGSVLGGDGEDRLALKFLSLPPNFVTAGLIDGGGGFDTAQSKGNVTIVNCEG